MADILTTQKQVRVAFWREHPTASRKKLPSGDFVTDTRCLFVDFVDRLQKDGNITEKLASRVTLEG